jgi:hypothetical protein
MCPAARKYKVVSLDDTLVCFLVFGASVIVFSIISYLRFYIIKCIRWNNKIIFNISMLFSDSVSFSETILHEFYDIFYGW